MTKTPYLKAAQAAAELGVTVQTLYAYASRGMVRSEPETDGSKSRRYAREDIDRLKQRKEARSDPDKAASQSLHWGGPVLESALTLIDHGAVYYRGRNVAELALSCSVEEVAALLWTGEMAQASALFGGKGDSKWGARPMNALLRRLGNETELGPIERCQIALAWAGAHDLTAYDLRQAAVAATGAKILRLLTAAVAGSNFALAVDSALQQAWAPKRRAVGRALRAALILCADHELNVSAFAARCVASAAATPYDVVSAGLAAMKGARHGGVTIRVDALLQEAARASKADEAIAARLRRGDLLPGFGHPLYPEGDPRAEVLLALGEELGNARAVELVRAITGSVRKLTGEQPNVDFALASLSRALGLPASSALAIFALGRTIGWIAHAIEQYRTGELIRPRARYTGQLPLASSTTSKIVGI